MIRKAQAIAKNIDRLSEDNRGTWIDNATDAFMKAIQSDPGGFEANYAFANFCRLDLREDRMALQHYEAAAASSPSSTRFWADYAGCAQDLRKSALAAKLLEKACGAGALSWEQRVEEARVHLKAKRFAKVVPLCSELLKDPPPRKKAVAKMLMPVLYAYRMLASLHLRDLRRARADARHLAEDEDHRRDIQRELATLTPRSARYEESCRRIRSWMLWKFL